MTRSDKRELVLEYFRRLDESRCPLDLFHNDAEVDFPKWGRARGVGEIERLLEDLTGWLLNIVHEPAMGTMVIEGDAVVVEGTSRGTLRSGSTWPTPHHPDQGRWCAVFRIADGVITRYSLYTDPDFAGGDIGSYPWARRS